MELLSSRWLKMLNGGRLITFRSFWIKSTKAQEHNHKPKQKWDSNKCVWGDPSSLLTAGSETFGERPRPDPASGSYRRKKHKALLFGFIISPTEDHGQNSGHKEYFISCDKQRLQIPLTQVRLEDGVGLKDLMEVAVFLSPKHTNLHNNKTQKRKGTVAFAQTQTKPGSNVFEENTSLPP